jgi:hypothetical protein
MRSEAFKRSAVLALFGAASLLAQDQPLSSSSVNINLPKDSPVALISMSTGQSRATARGAALVLDLHMSLTLRNTGLSRIHGVTLRVVSQEVTLGGKGSVSVPSLNIGQGEAFPVRIDMQLMRPTQVAAGPLVEVNLDGVLYQDLSFYGPDRLHSRRILTAWEMEAQRDREYFKRVLAQSGPEGLRRAMLESLARQDARPRLTVSVQRGRSVTSAAVAPSDHAAQFAFVQFPDSPVEPLEGWAQVAGSEVRSPRIQVRNRSARAVKYVELAWLVRDQGGQQYMAASLPSSDPDLYLPAGQTARVLQDSALRFSRNGQPVSIQSMTGFVSQVEFTDGKVWVPTRQSLQTPELQKVLAPSAEEQRLSELYRKKNLDALIQELKKF